MFQCRFRVVRAVLVDCLTPNPVASGRRADEGESAQSPESPVGPRFCGYLPVLIFASSVWASANVRTVAAADALVP